MKTTEISCANLADVAEKFVAYTENQDQSIAKAGRELAANAAGGMHSEEQSGKWTWTFRF